MTYDSSAHFQIPEPYYTSLFEALACSSYLLKMDAPHYTILACTQNILKLTGLQKTDVIGAGFFDVFPPHSNKNDNNSEQLLRDSLAFVVAHKKAHQLPTFKFSIANELGQIVERSWRIENRPVLAANGELAYIVHTTEDKTEQVMARKLAQESEHNYHRLFESMDQGYCTLEILFEGSKCVDYRYLETNPSFEHHLGMGNVVGKRIREIVPDIESKWFDFYGGVALTGTPIQIEEESKAFNKWFQVHAVRLGNAEERKVGVLFTDITARKRAEQALLESEAHFRKMVELAPVAIALTRGPDLVIESINTPMLKIWKKQYKDEVLGKKMVEVLPGKENQAVLDTVKNVLQTGETFLGTEVPVALYTNGASQINYYNLSYTPVMEAGKTTSVLHIAIDVTEQVMARRKIEESEAKLRSILNSASAAMGVFVGPDLIVENPNQLLIDVMAAGPDIEGKSFRKLLSGLVEEDKQFLAIIDGVRNSGEAFEAQEVKVFFKWEKKTRYFNINFIPLRDGTGDVYAVLDVSVDVTEQVLDRQKIEESEGRFRLLADASPNLIWLLHPDGSYAYVNKTTLDFLNVNQEKIAALGWAPFQHPDDLEPATKAITTAIQNRQPYEMEHRMLHRDGSYRWVLSQALPAYDAEGNVFSYVGSSIDIHKAKLAQQALVESEARFRTLADESPVFVFIIDVGPLASVSYWNRTWLTYTGQTFEEAIGKAWNGILHADDITMVMDHYVPAFHKRAPYLIPAVRVKRSDGEYRWHTFKGNPRHLPNGDFNGYIGMGFDIHEQKLAQQQLETTLEQARLSKEAAELGTFDLDLEKGYMHWDNRCRTLFGISHNSSVSFEEDFLRRLHPEDHDRVVEVIARAYNKMISNGDYDVEYRTIGAEDSIVRWVRAKGKVYFDIQEQPVRFIGSVLDITEQKTTFQKIERLVDERTRQLAQANESLLQANKELQRSNANLEEFTYAASHDLKEPIRKITVFNGQLREQLEGRLKDSERNLFGRVQNATERMRNLIDDLLLYSHVTQRPHQAESVNLNHKVHRVLEDLELDIKDKSARIEFEGLPVVKGYKRQLQQVFQNLISNALKYSKADVPPHITIGAKQVEEHGKPYHLIAVKDNGIGFEEEYADKIFHMFTRLHGKAEYGGTGVGLSIVKKVIENHDGMIRVESTPDVGSTFFIYLPA